MTTYYEPDRVIVMCGKKNCDAQMVFEGAKFSDWDMMIEKLKAAGFVIVSSKNRYTKRVFFMHYCKEHAPTDRLGITAH